VDLDKALRGALINTLEALEKGDVRGGSGAAEEGAEYTKVTAPVYDGEKRKALCCCFACVTF
jgi:hypothetical protein